MAALPDFIANPDPAAYLGDNYLVVDFETTNFEKGSALDPRNSLLLACWRVGKSHARYSGNHSYSHWGDEFSQGALLDAIGSSDFIVAHFTKFELQWLKRCGADLRSILPYCTQIGEYVRAGNRKWQLGLDRTAKRYGLEGKSTAVAALIHEHEANPADIPPCLLEPYCAQDVEETERVFLRQRKALHEAGLLPAVYCRNIVTPCLADIEAPGMALDADRVLPLYAERMAAYNAKVAEFDAFTGGINPKSPQQMAEYLYTKLGFKELTDRRGNPIRTKGGKKGKPAPKTDKKTLPLLEASTPEQKKFKKLAMEVAVMKTPVNNLKKMKAALDSGSNLVYAVFNQTVARNHRLSSSGRNGGFQFQNFDRAFKPVFKARKPGWLMVEADAPQLEFRVATDASEPTDPVALNDIVTGADVHALTSQVLGVSRQDAKSSTFKPLYGGQSGTKKEMAYYKAFRDKYSGIFKTQTGWTHEVLKTGKLRIPSGLIFYWPDTKMTQSGFITNTPSIFNYPVSSFSTDLMQLTMVLVWHRIAGTDALLVNAVHDSLVAEVPAEGLEAYKYAVVKSFTHDIYHVVKRLYGRQIKVPLGVGIKAGTHWGEGAEEKHNGSVVVA